MYENCLLIQQNSITTSVYNLGGPEKCTCDYIHFQATWQKNEFWCTGRIKSGQTGFLYTWVQDVTCLLMWATVNTWKHVTQLHHFVCPYKILPWAPKHKDCISTLLWLWNMGQVLCGGGCSSEVYQPGQDDYCHDFSVFIKKQYVGLS